MLCSVPSPTVGDLSLSCFLCSAFLSMHMKVRAEPSERDRREQTPAESKVLDHSPPVCQADFNKNTTLPMGNSNSKEQKKVENEAKALVALGRKLYPLPQPEDGIEITRKIYGLLAMLESNLRQKKDYRNIEKLCDQLRKLLEDHEWRYA
ncbi:uncharacterized protein CLAFUR5_09857 [Fulvia fulva]|uniref:Uncharacterized protein n=1 Tax=Passalora fulva TaxID=5499 RepID=A0A9Q8URP9_PASFU|nr:uncharacterized protein CLAFUR5_09857 [Fulvia fulva]UJO19960.1 hypothetical protein CLAFUR5_09857 [Fulvia fulva]